MGFGYAELFLEGLKALRTALGLEFQTLACRFLGCKQGPQLKQLR